MDSPTRPPPPYRPLPSAHRTIAWPALPGPQAALKAALLQQLEQSQWWSAARLRGEQFRQAGALLDHAYRQVPFYRDRLAQAGFVPGQPLTEEIWARIPVLTRAEVQEAGAGLHSAQIPEAHGEIYELSTSGSTGRPIRARGTRLVQLFWDAMTLREHLWQGRDFAGKLAAIRSFPTGVAQYPQGSVAGDWGRSTKDFCATGPSTMLSIGSAVEDQADWLARQDADYLLTYPSNLRELLRHSRRTGQRYPTLRQVRTLSEVLSPAVRDLCQEVWGLEIADLYSTQEAGYLAFQCAEHGAYHVQSEVALLEVLDDAGNDCAAGAVGRVVVTPLHNFAMPMIRYAVGDLAEVGTDCPCGRGLPVLQRILGRARNMIVYPDGRRAWPLLGDFNYTEIPAIRQYQVVQKTVTDFEIRMVTERPLTEEEGTRVRTWLHERCGHPFNVTITYHDEILRGPSGKFEDFRSEVTA
ncbi:phenylacetate--CoA ligase family protein [Pelagibius sp.]|uniref:phenylacetate--CoA ligase family protein n=1 Tax=Pelagibius sp. TaxID=1931238 RepID=UPI003B50922C